MFTGTAFSVTGGAKGRDIAFFQQFIDDLPQGTVIVDQELLFIRILFVFRCLGISSDLKFCAGIDLVRSLPFLQYNPGYRKGVRHRLLF